MLLRRLQSFLADNDVDIGRLFRKMDVNGDGFLSKDELSEGLNMMGIVFGPADVIVLHKYLSGDDDLTSLVEFFEKAQSPPAIEAHKTVPVVKKSGAVVNLDLDNVHDAKSRYEYGVGAMAPALADQSFIDRQSQQPLGDLAANPHRRRSQESREIGWHTKIIKQKETFGNIFEAAKLEPEVRQRRTSSYMFLGAKLKSLPPAPDDVAAIFTKIATYLKTHSIMMEELIPHLDVHGDGRLSQTDLKKQIISKVGVHISVAENMILFRYLSSLTQSDYAALDDFESAVAIHKPHRGGGTPKSTH
jgi:hypothetical protein